MGIYLTEELTNFVHEEKPPRLPAWNIDLGKANRALFETLFDFLFTDTVALASLNITPENSARIDGIIEANVDSFEFSLPQQSGTDQFAVWIRYNLQLLTPDGEPISNWPINAYGEAPDEGLTAKKAMELATRTAMRDAAASIIMGFRTAPGVQEKLLEVADDG